MQECLSERIYVGLPKILWSGNVEQTQVLCLTPHRVPAHLDPYSVDKGFDLVGHKDSAEGRKVPPIGDQSVHVVGRVVVPPVKIWVRTFGQVREEDLCSPEKPGFVSIYGAIPGRRILPNYVSLRQCVFVQF